MIGLQRLRIIAKLSGFRIHENRYVRLSKGSLFLFPFFYPIILINSLRVYYRNMKKNKELSKNEKQAVYKEQLQINISPKNLLNKHTFIVFEKEKNVSDVDFSNEDNIVKAFDEVM